MQLHFTIGGKIFINNGIKLFDFQNKESEIKKMIDEFCEDPLSGQLFENFETKTKLDEVIKSRMLARDAEQLFRILENEHKRIQRINKWKNKWTIRQLFRIKNKIQRICRRFKLVKI